MDINKKIEIIAQTITGYTVIVDTSNGANVELDKITMPCILIYTQQSGEYNTKNAHYRDSINLYVTILNKIPLGFKESDVENLRYQLKQDLTFLHYRLKHNFQFKINSDALKYQIVYDDFDANLIGLSFNDNVTEIIGVNLWCDNPQPTSFVVVIKDEGGNIIKTFYSSGEYTIQNTSEMIDEKIEFTNFIGNSVTLPHIPTYIYNVFIDDQPIVEYTYLNDVLTLTNGVDIAGTLTVQYKHP